MKSLQPEYYFLARQFYIKNLFYKNIRCSGPMLFICDDDDYKLDNLYKYCIIQNE